MSTCSDDDVLVVLPSKSTDMGSQRCWLGPQLMSLCNLRFYDTVAIYISSHRSYLCRVWPRIDGNGNSYIQFDGTVGSSSDGTAFQTHTVNKPFTIAKTSVSKVTCSALKSITLSVVVNSRQEVLSYRRECTSFLESRIRHFLRGLTVASNYTVLCASLNLGSVYDWDRVIVHGIDSKKEAYCGTVVDSTAIVVKQLCYKAKFDQKSRESIKVGGLDCEIRMLRNIVTRFQPTEHEDAASLVSLNVLCFELYFLLKDI